MKPVAVNGRLWMMLPRSIRWNGKGPGILNRARVEKGLKFRSGVPIGYFELGRVLYHGYEQAEEHRQGFLGLKWTTRIA